MANTVQHLSKAPQSFSAAIASAAMQASIRNTLRDAARADRFTANLITMVTLNSGRNPNGTPSGLAACDPKTIISAALLGETLNLNPAPALGQFYVVPFKDKAVFVLGYRGYLQLAIRSGEFRRFNALAIKEGEFLGWNPLTEDLTVKIVEDEERRAALPTAGFYAMFETTNGFRKETYWSLERLQSHAERYCNGNYDRKVHEQFRADEAKGLPLKALQQKYGPWYLHFETMACKTLIRSIIKFAPMSPQLMNAAASDEKSVTMNANGDLAPVEIDVEAEAPVAESAATANAPAALPAPEERPTVTVETAPRRRAKVPASGDAETPTAAAPDAQGASADEIF